MENKKNFLALILVLVVLLAAAAFGYKYLTATYSDVAPKISAEDNSSVAKDVQPESEGESEPTPAPDFTVLNKEGEKVTLSSKKGKPVVVNFWASWCGPCKNEMPDFDAAYKKYGDDVEFMMVNLTDGRQETVEKATKLIEKNGYEFPVYFDTEREAAYIYQTVSIPRTLFVDKDGNAEVIYVGMITDKVIEEQIEKLLQ